MLTLRKYESFRQRRLDEDRYLVRCRFGVKLDRSLFRDYDGFVERLLEQRAAHRLARTAEPGWQDAMMRAGIWDDDKVRYDESVVGGLPDVEQS